MPRTSTKSAILSLPPKQKRGKQPKPVNEKLTKLVSNVIQHQTKKPDIDNKELEIDDDTELEISNEIIAVKQPSNNEAQLKQLNELIEHEKKASMEQLAELKKLLEESKISKVEAEKALKIEIDELKQNLKDLENKKAIEMKSAIKEIDKKAQIEVIKKIRSAGLRL